jgi:hypothetical protein
MAARGMRLVETWLAESPLDHTMMRLSGTVARAATPTQTETLWVDVPKQYEADISRSGNPWLLWLLYPAVFYGEPLEIPLPVDRVLYENVHEIVRYWNNWGLRYWNDGEPVRTSGVRIEADVVDVPPPSNPNSGRTLTYYSGGVDAYFTILTDNPAYHPERHYAVDELQFIQGFDTRPETPAELVPGWQRLLEKMQWACSQLGKPLLVLNTNLRFSPLCLDLIHMHGLILAGLGLVLEPRYRRILIASDTDYSSRVADFGIPPFLPPLLSTSRLSFLFDGGSFNRIQKTAVVAESPVAQKSLHVCWMYDQLSELNCGQCAKCRRVCAQLDALNRLRDFTVFKTVDYAQTHGIRRPLPIFELHYLQEMRPVAAANQREDVVRYIDRAVRLSTTTRRGRIVGWLSRWVMPAAFANGIGRAIDGGYRMAIKRRPAVAGALAPRRAWQKPAGDAGTRVSPKR